MFKKSLALAIAFLVASFATGFAQDPAAQCTQALQDQRAALQELITRIEREGVNDETVRQMTNWADGFHRAVSDPTIGDHIEAMTVGTGAGVLGSLALGGPPGWAAAAAGAAIGSAYMETKSFLETIASWDDVDANTAFYQYLIDYVEYGRVQSMDDPALNTFLTRHSAVLQQLTGNAPPLGNPAQLHLYLQANADQLLLFFGYFEENSPGNTFPRWRFPETQGRYGPNRLDVGYYKRLIAGRIADELRQMDAEIATLQAACDTDPTETPVTIAPCGGAPGAGAETTCSCALSQPKFVWGDDLYTGDSDICTAAVHAGLLRPGILASGGYGWSGIVHVASARGCPYYEGVSRNGITTLEYGGWGGSFYFPAVQRGLCDESSSPATGVWYCPATLGSATDITCHCTPDAMARGSIWGSVYYTNDSSLCRAALHAGAVSPYGGTIRAILLGGLDAYEGTTSNGVTSLDYGGWGASVGFP